MNKEILIGKIITIVDRINENDSCPYGDYAILIIRNDAPENINYFIKCFKKYKMRYESALILTDSVECKVIVKKYISSKDKVIIFSEEEIDCLCRVINAQGDIKDVFYNKSLPMDDADTSLLLGDYNLTNRDIIARVYLGMLDTPSDEELISGDVNSKDNGVQFITKWKDFSDFVMVHPEGEAREEYSQRIEITSNRLIENKWIKDSNTLVLYGDTRFSSEYILNQKDRGQIRIVDRNPEKRGGSRHGVTVCLPEEVLMPYDANIRILVTQNYYRSVCEYLASLGYWVGKQVWVVNVTENFWNWSRNTIQKWVGERYDRAKNCYIKLREKYPYSTLFLSPWSASGDIYLAGLYLNEYIQKNGLKDYVIVSTAETARRVAGLFGYDCFIISEEEALDIMWLARIEGFEKLGIMNININVKPGQRIGNIQGIVDFNTFYQRLVFHSEQKYRIPEIFQRDSTELFKVNGLKQEKTILIAPYSQTLGNIPNNMCEKIVQELQSEGFTVCTNVSGDERPILGTKGIFIPYDQVLDFVNKAGGFIGMRSGLCDIISSSTAKMVVFFRNRTSIGNSMMYHFGLQRMGLKNQDILEYAFEENEEDYLVEKTVELFCN